MLRLSVLARRTRGVRAPCAASAYFEHYGLVMYLLLTEDALAWTPEHARLINGVGTVDINEKLGRIKIIPF